jgi:hypothetical protein
MSPEGDKTLAWLDFINWVARGWTDGSRLDRRDPEQGWQWP